VRAQEAQPPKKRLRPTTEHRTRTAAEQIESSAHIVGGTTDSAPASSSRTAVTS